MYLQFAQYILLERKKHPTERVWGALLDAFPQDFAELPLSFTEEELEYLEGSPYRDGIREEQMVIKEKYAEICKEIPDFKQFTYAEFCEAMTIAYSRVFSV